MNATARLRATGRRHGRGKAVRRSAICLAAALLALSSGTAHASTALLLGGRGKYAKLTEDQMSTAFGGYFAGYDQRVNVPFPGTSNLYYSVQVGADNLYAAVYDPAYAGPKTIGGVSEGAPSVIEVLRRLEADRADETDGKEPPPASELNVAIYGWPSKRFLGDLADLPMPVTPYDVIIVKAEYDGIADWPDNPWNFLAVQNAILGAMQLHVKQSNFDIRNNPTEYTIETNAAGGTTTTILIPTEVLPVLAPMVAFHFNPEFIARMDARLRPKIDAAYDRPPMETGIPPTLTGPPGTPATPTTEPEVVSASVATAAQAKAPQSSGTTTRKHVLATSRTQAVTSDVAQSPEITGESEENAQSDDATNDTAGEKKAEKSSRGSLLGIRRHQKRSEEATGGTETDAGHAKEQSSTTGAAGNGAGAGSSGSDDE